MVFALRFGAYLLSARKAVGECPDRQIYPLVFVGYPFTIRSLKGYRGPGIPIKKACPGKGRLFLYYQWTTISVSTKEAWVRAFAGRPYNMY